MKRRATPKRPRLTDSNLAAGRKIAKPFADPFATTNLHPPAARPPGSANKLAMDSAMNDTLGWALAVAQSGFSEGLIFLGYSYLAELAQRAEYRRISEVISTEMTRKWMKISATGDEDKTDKVKAIEAAFEALKVREAFQKAALYDGFMGRSHLYLDFGELDRDEMLKPIGDGRNEFSRGKVSKTNPLRRIQHVEAVWTYPTNYNSNDPLANDWYKPSTWFVMGKELHATRLLTFVGREVPDLLKPAFSFGGLSLTQMAKPYVDNWLRTRQSVADIVHSFTVFLLKTNLAASLGPNGEELERRVTLFNNLRDNRGLMVVDEETEDFANVSAPLSSLDLLQAQSQEHIASVTGIPLVKLLGIQPAGLNASSEGEIRVFYDWIAAYQKHLFDENVKRILGFVQLSLFGEVDSEITHTWNKLYELTEKEEAEVRKLEAETDEGLIDHGVLDPAESRKRIAADPDTPYAGLDPDLLPTPPDGGASGEEPDASPIDPDADLDDKGTGANGLTPARPAKVEPPPARVVTPEAKRTVQ